MHPNPHTAMTTSDTTALGDLATREFTTDLRSLALIEVRGEDAQSFLQGQFSNDITAIAAEADGARRCQLNAYCNPQGRALALIRLIRHDYGFRMIVPATLTDSLIKRLNLFILRARVRLEVNTRFALFGLINGGEDTAGLPIVERVSVDGILPRQILLVEKRMADSFQDARFDRRMDGNAALDAYARTWSHENGDELWRLLDILSGIPQIYPQTVAAFIPQMINLDRVDGLSFTKGCYPGQEIIARLRYRGRVKQRMLIGRASELESLAPGDPLYPPQDCGKKPGVVVDAVSNGDGEYTLSATVPTDLPEDEVLRVGSPTGAALTRLPLPYSAETE